MNEIIEKIKENNKDLLEIYQKEDNNIYQREDNIERKIPIENIKDKYIILLKNSKNYRYLSIEKFKKNNNYIIIENPKIPKNNSIEKINEIENQEKMIIDNLDDNLIDEYFGNKEKIKNLKIRNLEIIEISKKEKEKRDNDIEYRLRKEIEKYQRKLNEYLEKSKKSE